MTKKFFLGQKLLFLFVCVDVPLLFNRTDRKPVGRFHQDFAIVQLLQNLYTNFATYGYLLKKIQNDAYLISKKIFSNFYPHGLLHIFILFKLGSPFILLKITRMTCESGKKLTRAIKKWNSFKSTRTSRWSQYLLSKMLRSSGTR